MFWKVWNTTKASYFISTNYVDSFDRAFESRTHASLQQRKELDVKSLWTISQTSLGRHDASRASVRLQPAQPFAGAVKFYGDKLTLLQSLLSSANRGIEKELAALDVRLAQSHIQSHKTSVAAVKNLVVAILINGDDIENSLKAAQLLATNHLERAMAYGYFALMMHTT